MLDSLWADVVSQRSSYILIHFDFDNSLHLLLTTRLGNSASMSTLDEKHLNGFPPPASDEEAIRIDRDWTIEEERAAKRK